MLAYVKCNELKVGDRFIEDTFPEVWEVTGYGDYLGNQTIEAKCVTATKYTCEGFVETFFESPGFNLCLYKVS